MQSKPYIIHICQHLRPDLFLDIKTPKMIFFPSRTLYHQRLTSHPNGHHSYPVQVEGERALIQNKGKD